MRGSIFHTPPTEFSTRHETGSYVNNNNLECNASNRLSSSEEDNSPTQMNNCRKLIDKAPLVKRLSNSLLRSSDEYRPLINDNDILASNRNYLSASSAHIYGTQATNATAINDYAGCDANEMIASRFGESCRKSLTSVVLDNRKGRDYCDFDLKQNFLRETSSGK